MADPFDELRERVAWADEWLDSQVPEHYKKQPLAQDWARVAKAGEEAGEAIDALIAWTGQNPRKGFSGTREELLDELCDVALTGMYAIQHFTKNSFETMALVLNRAKLHRERLGAEWNEVPPEG